MEGKKPWHCLKINVFRKMFGWKQFVGNRNGSHRIKSLIAGIIDRKQGVHQE